jgi:hypothetical protein
VVAVDPAVPTASRPGLALDVIAALLRMNWGRFSAPAAGDGLAAELLAAPPAPVVAIAGAFCRQPLIVTISARVWADGDAGAR